MQMIAVNITIELMGCAVSLILLFSLLVHGDLKRRAGVLFGCVLGMQLLILACDAASWALTGRPGTGAHRASACLNFVTFSGGVAIQIVFMAYLLACIDQREPVSHAPMRAVILLCCIVEGLIIASQFNGMIYTIDARNAFRTGPQYWLLVGGLSATFVHFSITAWKHRRILGNKDALLFVLYAVMMVAALIVEAFFDDVMINYGASTLLTLMIYVNIQAQKRAKLEMEMMDTRVAVMLSQIQPHFLYNVLVAIERLCVKDPPQAQTAIASFSTYLRRNLDSLSMRSPIPFADELEHVRVYLSLEMRRFGDRLQVVYDIQAEAFMLPALTLQAVVENAVQHGVTQRTRGGTVTIRTRAEDRHWCVAIEDDGMGFDANAVDMGRRTHIGLQNVRSRLAFMCAGRLEIESQPGKGTTVKLIIPKEGVA